MRDKRAPEPPTSVIATHWAVIIAILAFSAGSGMSWLILQERHSKPTGSQPPAFPTQTTGPAAGGSSFAAPDVSQMSPAEAALALGNWNYDHQGWQRAIESYQRAISLGMESADVRTDLGNALRFSGEPEKALEQYQAARRLNPQHENSLCNMATLYAQVLNDPASAVAAWNEYLRLFPNGEKSAVARQFVATESQKLP
ncbi:MAG: tetratricopeptide repeat protein [Verrucomicrobia bacterium]|nr:tetratricopeptide repeat protein [Verrucomicrobiota bacterium]